MLLGKRPRPPMRRTTSMTEFSVDLSGIEPQPSDQRGHSHHKTGSDGAGGGSGRRQADGVGYVPSASPKGGHMRNSGDFVETAPFLRACGLCRRRLARGRDIYMYKGDTAFCSLECRQQQMNQDERREKCSLASMKEGPSSSAATAAASGSEAASNNGETVAAA